MRISQVKELQAEMTEAWSSYSPLELTGSSRNFPCYNRSMVRTEGGTLPCQTEPQTIGSQEAFIDGFADQFFLFRREATLSEFQPVAGSGVRVVYYN